MNTITCAHKIRLNPTPEQEMYFRKAAGIKRFVYNTWMSGHCGVLHQRDWNAAENIEREALRLIA